MLDIIVELYGPRLNTADLASALKTTPENVRNEISAERFPIPIYKDKPTKKDKGTGRNQWYADARDVAEYLDRMRPKPKAAPPASQGRDGYNA